MKIVAIVLGSVLALPGQLPAAELGRAVRKSAAASRAPSLEESHSLSLAALEGSETPGNAVDAGDAEGLGTKPQPPGPARETEPAGSQPQAVDIGMPEPEEPGQEEKKPGFLVRVGKGLGGGLLGIITGPFLYGAAGVLWAKSKADETDSKLWYLAMPFAFIVGFLFGLFMGPYKGFKEGWEGR